MVLIGRSTGHAPLYSGVGGVGVERIVELRVARWGDLLIIVKLPGQHCLSRGGLTSLADIFPFL
jgi:hypothetical protein